MIRISSATTSFHKKVVPILGLVSLLLWLTAIFASAASRSLRVLSLGLAPVAGCVGYTFWKFLVRDLADEVHDAHEFLVVRKDGNEQHVPLADIESVRSSRVAKLPRISLKLTGASAKGTLGEEVEFSPANAEVAQELTARADRARRVRAGLTTSR